MVGPAEWLAWSTGNGTLDQVPQGSVEAIYASYVLQVRLRPDSTFLPSYRTVHCFGAALVAVYTS